MPSGENFTDDTADFPQLSHNSSYGLPEAELEEAIVSAF